MGTFTYLEQNCPFFEQVRHQPLAAFRITTTIYGQVED